MEITTRTWAESQSLQAKRYICGHCGSLVSSVKGIGCKTSVMSQGRLREGSAMLYFCPHCGLHTFFDIDGSQSPSPRIGREIDNLPDEIRGIYNEARDCFAAGACTGAALCCRKLLMNICVQEGMEEGKQFTEYVDAIIERGLVPKKTAAVVEKIRLAGNRATHGTTPATRQDTETILKFLEMVLTFNYDFDDFMQPEE